MEATEKLTKNWKKEVWKSLEEQDLMKLRNKLNNIYNQSQNELQSYNMNSSENLESMI